MASLAPMARLLALLLIAILPLSTAAQRIASGSVSDDDSDVTPQPQNVVKVLVCGDSITQGVEGDFTWRYRLWEWFYNNAGSASTSTPSSASSTYRTPSLQYVGPYNGTLPADVDAVNLDPTVPQTWGTYHPTVNPLFYPGGGSSHFAVYGRPAWLDVDVIEGHVANYQPEFVILHLGFNDFGWWGQNATELVAWMQKLVWNSRLGRRDVKVLIADVSHRVLVVGREDIPVTTDQYNAMMTVKVLEWSTAESPVAFVRVSQEYGCHVDSCPAGIDGLHPNSLGDYQIARAYTKILHEQFHFGAGPLVVPPIQDIPGMEVASTKPMRVFTSPPVFIFFLVAVVCLWVAFALRPDWMRGAASRTSSANKGRYELLPRDESRVGGQ